MSRTILIRVSAGFLALAAAWVAYTQNPPQAGQAKAPAPLVLTKVTDDLYVIEGSGGNVAVYITTEGVILVDDKFEQNFDEILANVKKVTGQPVKYVLNTHEHGDHTGGNAKMLPVAEIIAHKNARANMMKNKQPGAPRVTFADEAEVYLGGKEVRARHFGRGHTNGDAFIYFPALRTIHTGDMFVRGAPNIDYNNGASLTEWTRTIDQALKLDFDTVIPGHGAVSKRQDLIDFRNRMENIRERVTQMTREGKGKDDVAKMLVADFGWPGTGLSISRVDGMIAELRR